MSSTGGLRESERRPLRVFAFDPMVDRFRPPVVLRVPFEHVKPGPIGRLLSVVDLDIDRNKVLPPLDLDDPRVLIGSGLTPLETDFRSHQQVVYAVSMAVYEAFERGLGRPILWHAGRRLRLVPHAGPMANAFFHPETFSVLFGAFKAVDQSPGGNLAGQTVYSCLAWDVVGHEVSHPVLGDLRPFEVGPRVPHPRYPDTFAVHEGFCDFVALLVRLTERSVVMPILTEFGPSLKGTPLLRLASQFGQATGMGQALREFPSAAEVSTETEPHVLGESFASTFIEAFLETLSHDTRDLFGLHGAPRSDGWLHPDLVGRIAGTTTKLAREVLDVCIGALDLLPPFDVRFGDFLRAVVTVSTERFGPRQEVFRSKLIEAFRVRGMTPIDVESLAVEALHLQTRAFPGGTPLPHVDDALLLTQHALALRRAYMADPEYIDEAAAAVNADLRKMTRWKRDVVAFAKVHATRLGLERTRPVKVENLTGSFGVDATGNVRARVTVQIIQPSTTTSPRRGVTLVANSNGEIEYQVRTHDRRGRRESTSWPFKNPVSDHDLVTALAGYVR